ncbi:UNKNOWN [Stylonychia lemnae]|uniref:Uncharacterized protein n=1 Tax=Stylonychia lemnae TaxID=5949 RepID=A0A078AHG7_STYLE|nr:UNKNOWN [Stylonychia lemnae]|eukprot:CDW81694.1 UNKNOWN [Stylonychia lemnae]
MKKVNYFFNKFQDIRVEDINLDKQAIKGSVQIKSSLNVPDKKNTAKSKELLDQSQFNTRNYRDMEEEILREISAVHQIDRNLNTTELNSLQYDFEDILKSDQLELLCNNSYELQLLELQQYQSQDPNGNGVNTLTDNFDMLDQFKSPILSNKIKSNYDEKYRIRGQIQKIKKGIYIGIINLDIQISPLKV